MCSGSKQEGEMNTRRFRVATVFLSVMLVAIPLVGCGATPTPTAVPTQAPTAVPTKAAATQAPPTQPPATKAPPTATKVPPTATPVPTKGPAVGGTLVLAGSAADPDSLDGDATVSWSIMPWFGSTLVIRDLNGNTFVPYLAESWTVSPDGLTMDFAIKKGIKFHDGNPCTAKDIMWTFNRAKDPAFSMGAAKGFLAPVVSVEAPDDYTLRLKLEKPYAPMLMNLYFPFLHPISKAAVDKWGTQYGFHPVSVGPWTFKEWQTGSKIVLKRNAEFNWGPSYAHQGPPYIETVEYRLIAEKATINLGLEAGELDYAGLDAKDVPRLEGTGKVDIYPAQFDGLKPYITMNLKLPLFQDRRVRQAFNLAIDKDQFIKAAFQGQAFPLYGVLSPATYGHWSGIEQVGYHFNLAKAKALMAEAGYTPGPDGILTKDGKPLKLTLITWTILDFPKYAEILQEQYKHLGVDITLQTGDIGLIIQQAQKGDYELYCGQINNPDADLLSMMFHSSQIGALNFSFASDPVLDKLIEDTQTAVSIDSRQAAIEKAETYIVENALFVPVASPTLFEALSKRVQGELWTVFGEMNWFDAYIVK